MFWLALWFFGGYFLIFIGKGFAETMMKEKSLFGELIGLLTMIIGLATMVTSGASLFHSIASLMSGR